MAAAAGPSSETDLVEPDSATANLSGNLMLGTILDSARLVRSDFIVVRHTYTTRAP